MQVDRTAQIVDYSFRAEDELLLDANIWVFVYGTHGPNDRRAFIYSDALKRMIAAKSRLFTHLLIISEFINADARMAYGKWENNKSRNGFKKFRSSDAFKPIAEEIALATQKFLSHCRCIEGDFETSDVDKLITQYGLGDSDFNDEVIAALCRKKGLTLVTDDGDFHGQGIPVVTANPRLLE